MEKTCARRNSRLIDHPLVVWVGATVALVLSVLICSVPLDFYQQLIFALFTLGFSLLVRPEPDDTSRYRRIVLIAISCIATGRYLYWRITESMGWFGSNLDLSAADYFFSFGLLMAELYAWGVLYLGFFQTIWPLKRPTMPLPPDRSQWPSVDVLIPTYNEPLNVVVPSVLAAKNLDWPKNRLKVYILDDGCREEFRQFAMDADVSYIERHSSEGAKAGNINHALAQTRGEYVAIFDCDHAPVRSFLTKTMGWFLRKKKLGLIQTPHLFFSPDPVERNLEIFRSVPNEGQLFYGLVQDGNDLWNATFFCGSCAVMRREALESIGGIATDTVTEDAHTSLLMHNAQWDSAYLNIPLAAGLATERLSAHVGQRIRWARGMVQIFRTDNPLLARGLKLAQRLSYFNAMFHFFFSLPRIVFLTAPLAYLLLEAHVIQAAAAMIAVYALPHIIQSHIANTSLQGKFRHSFWAEVYETILATHIFWPTLKAMISPKLGKFNVTDKGGIIQKDYFDWDTAMPLFFILLLNIAGFIVGIGRLLWWNVHETDTVIMTLAWTVYNMIILGAALAVARERKQMRTTVRIPRQERAEVILAGGRTIGGTTTDLSLVNAGLSLDELPKLDNGDQIEVRLYDANRFYTFPCTVSSINSLHLGITFRDLNAEQMTRLVYFTHSKDHSWDAWYGNCEPSRSLKSFFEVVRYGFAGLRKAMLGDRSLPAAERHTGHMLGGWVLIFVVVLFGIFLAPKSAHALSALPQTEDISLQHMGADTPLSLNGSRTDWGLDFRLRPDYLVENASLKLQYAIAPELGYDFSELQVKLNGEIIERLAISESSGNAQFEINKQLSALLFSDLNHLSFHLVDMGNAEACRNPASALINNKSVLTLTSRPLQLANELKLLPLPFLDVNARGAHKIPFVINADAFESAESIKAMAIVASWFGTLAPTQTLTFPLLQGTADEHAVIFATQASHPQWLNTLDFTAPAVSMVSAPTNPLAKLLVFSGRSPTEMLQAVTAFASGQLTLAGAGIALTGAVEPTPRKPYDAPNWLQANRTVDFSELVPASQLKVHGFATAPIYVKFQLPPDLFSWKGDGIPVQLGYSLNHSILDRDSSIDLTLNDIPLRRIDLFETEQRPLSANQVRALLMQPVNQINVDDTLQLEDEKQLFLPIDEMGAVNTLSTYFNIRPPVDLPDYCEVLRNLDMQSQIDEGSSIDLSDFNHFLKMPSLRRFATHGFPFTRLADLSETAVILPDSPSAQSIETLLQLTGKFGSDTGYPVLGVTLQTAANVEQVRDKDLLLIGTARNQPLFHQWHGQMPIAPGSERGEWTVRNLTLMEKLTSWRDVNQKQERIINVEHALSSNTDNLISVFGFRSPLHRHRSVVAIAASTPYGLLQASNAVHASPSRDKVAGSLMLLVKDQVENYDISKQYFSGRLPVWSGLRWQLSNNMVYLLVLFVMVVFIVAGFAYIVLSNKARQRLELD